MTVGDSENYIASKDPITTGHGVDVTGAIWFIATELIYDFHRIVIDNGGFKPSNFLKAMENVRKSSVELVNISGGLHHTDCEQRCRICKATREVAASGKVVVAAAGDTTDGDSKGMYCPALSNKAISVGAFETRCECPMPSGPGSAGIGPDSLPPGAYWIKEQQTGTVSGPTNEAFCSFKQCTPAHTCDAHRSEVVWDENVDHRNGEPDVYAPHHVLRNDGSGPYIGLGTSFAAATVTGALADILSTVATERPMPTKDEVLDTVRQLDTTVGETEARKFDSELLLGMLR